MDAWFDALELTRNVKALRTFVLGKGI